MAKYGKKAAQKVKRAMHERKAGTLKSGRSGKESEKPQAGNRDRPFGSARAGAKVPKKRSAKKKTGTKRRAKKKAKKK